MLRASTIESNRNIKVLSKGNKLPCFSSTHFFFSKKIYLFYLSQNWNHLIILRRSVRHGTSSSRSSVLKGPQSTVDKIQQRFTLDRHLTWLTLNHLFDCWSPCQTILDQHSTDNTPKSVKCRPSKTFFTVTAEIHERSLAKFYCQYADRHRP